MREYDNHFMIELNWDVSLIDNERVKLVNLPIIYKNNVIGIITDTKILEGSLITKCLIWERFKINENQIIKSDKTISYLFNVNSAEHIPCDIIIYDEESEVVSFHYDME